MKHDDVPLRRLIDKTVVLMTVLATLAFSLGRGSVVLPLCSIGAASASLYLSAHKRSLVLNRLAINAIIILIAVAMASRLINAKASLEYSTLADGFVYLQCLLLFEKRTVRTWWDLMTLSFVLVFVASQMIQGPSFSLVLLAYFFCGLAALAEIQIYHRQRRWRMEESEPEFSRGRAQTTGAPRTDWLRVLKVAFCTLLVGPFSLFMRFRDTTDIEPLDAADPGENGKDAPVRGFELRSVLPPEFWRRLARLTAASVGLSCIVFLVVPRFGRVEFDLAEFRRIVWGDEVEDQIRKVGYRDSVKLGELGNTSENTAKALTLKLLDFDGQPVKVTGDIYLRGSVLTRYRNGSWEHHRYGETSRQLRLRGSSSEETAGIVRQQIVIEGMDHTGLFSVWPPVITDATDNIWYDEGSECFRRPRNRRGSAFQYELATSGFADGRQARLIPCGAKIRTGELLEAPTQDVPGLIDLAKEWIEQSGLPEDDWAARAEYLARQLSSSRRFSYSLNEQQRNPDLDPIEDFIVNNPVGNCEYFATALALMLRTQGIPTRVVVGYRTDEFGYFEQGYIVRQEHAHSWVETYIPPEQCRAVSARSVALADWSRGGWLRLEPTPAGPGVLGGLLGQGVENWLLRFRSFWANRIVGMNNQQRYDIVYGVVVGSLRGMGKRFFDPEWWKSLSRMNVREVEAGGRGRSVYHHSSVLYGGLVGILLILAAIYACLRLRLFNPRRQRPIVTSLQRRRQERRAVDVPFYRRLELLLAKFDLRRELGQTPREFANQIAGELIRATGESRAGEWVRDLAEAYYRVRYGCIILDQSQAATIQRLLDNLEQASANRISASS